MISGFGKERLKMGKEAKSWKPRLFNLDPQLLHDAVLLAIAVFVMFLFLSYMLFNPARNAEKASGQGEE